MCLAEINDVDPNEMLDESNNWLKEIDRGGLKHVTNMVYMMFASGESELRKHINESKSPDFNLKSAKDKLIQCEDVQFYWSIVACNWEEETSTVNRRMDPDKLMLIEEWIQIRGHSTATAWHGLSSIRQRRRNWFKSPKMLYRKQLFSSASSKVKKNDSPPQADDS